MDDDASRKRIRELFAANTASGDPPNVAAAKAIEQLAAERNAALSTMPPTEAAVAEPMEVDESQNSASPAEVAVPAAKPPPSPPPPDAELEPTGLSLVLLRQKLAEAEAAARPGIAIAAVGAAFSDSGVLAASFLPRGWSTPMFEGPVVLHGLDLNEVDAAYDELQRDEALMSTALSGMGRLLCQPYFATCCRGCNVPTSESIKFLRVFVIMLLNPELLNPDTHPFLLRLCGMIACLPDASRRVLSECWRAAGEERFVRLLSSLQMLMTLRLMTSPKAEEEVAIAMRVVATLHYANEDLGGNFVHFREFYNDGISQRIDPRDDYRRWMKQRQRHELSGIGLAQDGREDSQFFALCAHPYVLEPAFKARILAIDAQYTQEEALRSVVLSAVLRHGGELRESPYFVLRVRREHIVQDTMQQVNLRGVYEGDHSYVDACRGFGAYDSEYVDRRVGALGARAKAVLKKPLKVMFIGEEGVDEGGVRKEFFQARQQPPPHAQTC